MGALPGGQFGELGPGAPPGGQYGQIASEASLTDLAERSEAPNPGDQKEAEPPFLAAPRPMGGVAASI